MTQEPITGVDDAAHQPWQTDPGGGNGGTSRLRSSASIPTDVVPAITLLLGATQAYITPLGSRPSAAS